MDNTLHQHFADIEYLPGATAADYLDACRVKHPALYARLSLDRMRANRAVFQQIDSMSTTFEGTDKGGRGETYRQTQVRYPLARTLGIKSLFDILMPDGGSGKYILDVLGGNGTLTRTMRLVTPPADMPEIFTGDSAGSMVTDALARGFPAVRQLAQSLLLADRTMDGVIFAYGTHHVPVPDRLTALTEAHRILRPGGRVLVQDFVENSPTARWYSEVLEKYTLTGHDCAHFTEDGIRTLLEDAGFGNVRVTKVYDPCVVWADSADEAWVELLKYLVDLFGLEGLRPKNDQQGHDHWRMVREILSPYAEYLAGDDAGQLDSIKLWQDNGRHAAELPRVALVATGDRPA
ncbi:methyltransferase domain-containing protein [Actinocrispum sp. NPDC049592]|uniref:class I SAM-dependent methyltransferase n=1 Tax=Actinocrispum sp. NPDC049592 TaxID=3154835 RepID=UPI003413D060